MRRTPEFGDLCSRSRNSVGQDRVRLILDGRAWWAMRGCLLISTTVKTQSEIVGGESLKAMHNKYWLNTQSLSHRTAAPVFSPLGRPDASLPAARVLISNLSVSIPSWIILVMIILAVLGTASTVIVRMRGELQSATQQYQRTALEIDNLRRSNAALGMEIGRMASDPNVIESVARARLGMVMPNDIVVPAGTEERSNLGRYR